MLVIRLNDTIISMMQYVMKVHIASEKIFSFYKKRFYFLGKVIIRVVPQNAFAGDYTRTYH